MIQSLRNIRLRIRGIESTQKITHAMEMVSSFKLNRTKTALYAGLNYVLKLEAMLKRVLMDIETPAHPLLEARKTDGNIGLCVITSDTGLCSTYNHSAIKVAEDFINERGAEKIRLFAVGKEGFNYFKRENIVISGSYPDIHGRYSDKISKKITDDLIDIFLRGDVDEVYIAYVHFDTTLSHRPVLEKFLNIESQTKADINFIFEPDADSILNELIPMYAFEKIRHIILTAFTSEHAARMVAMKMATDNAEDIIDTLTMMKNKARQAAITKEVLEIASASEALKG